VAAAPALPPLQVELLPPLRPFHSGSEKHLRASQAADTTV